MKVAVITGITGQDGAYLAKFLLLKGYKVYGTYRRLSTPNFWRLQALGILDKVELVSFDLIDQSSMLNILKKVKPDEIYNLAAQSFVGASFEQPVSTAEITALGLPRILDVMRILCPQAKFYQASSSEMFGQVQQIPQNEKTPFYPRSPYAAAKLYAHWVTVNYREAYNLFTCSGILFNHESPLRGLEFVTRKITNAVARIKLGLQKELLLGNLDAKRDWGYAPDFVEAMWLMLQQEHPDDFVIATGETHTVREFCEVAFQEVGLNYNDYVKVDERFFRPSEVDLLIGDAGKAKQKLNWKPKTTFKELVKIMVQEDLNRWQRFQKGEHFPWDAPYDYVFGQTISPTYQLDR
ncbi:MAG TPA: GDP-mannose 4,6-dehydratase [Candidatus Nanoarchaeia archaeon]|nr:GDP-mannose 4,6-dehydratase [Candidatus Nanoarchaeia archaeon]